MILIALLALTLSFAGDLTVRKVVEDTLKGNLELKALRAELKAYDREYRSARALLFPTLSLEESFTRTDIPAYTLFTKMNQGRIGPQDFSPAELNDPAAVSGFETRFTLRIPLWMGGKLRAYRDMSLHRKRAQEKSYVRRREEVIFRAYSAFLKASFARSAVRLAEKNVESAQEHLRIAERLHRSGMALLSDVLRAKVALRKAEEKLKEARGNYRLSLRALGLIANTSYDGYDVEPLSSCPSLSPAELKEKALRNREDLRAVEDQVRALRAGYRSSLADTLPRISAFASYSLYDRDRPFSSEGEGYMVGLSVSVSFNTGLSAVEKARAFKERERALLSRRELLEKSILFEIDKAYTEYENALSALESASARVRSAEEMLRIVRKRYESGLARIVDLLDAQTQLELARFDYVRALYRCGLSYGRAVLSAGVIEEVLR